jgi:hypothetical protein
VEGAEAAAAVDAAVPSGDVDWLFLLSLPSENDDVFRVVDLPRFETLQKGLAEQRYRSAGRSFHIVDRHVANLQRLNDERLFADQTTVGHHEIFFAGYV